MELARGLGADVVHVAAAMTYTLVVLLAALLARGRATGREAAARMLLAGGIMLSPALGIDASTLLLSRLGGSEPRSERPAAGSTHRSLRPRPTPTMSPAPWCWPGTRIC